MGSIGNRNKTDKEEIKWSEELIQQQLRYSFLSPNSVKYFMENLNVYDWESDVLKITKSGYAYEFEIKISRADFKNDFKHKKKKHTLFENKENSSKIPNYFYYVVPEGLVSEEEIPEYAGLIYVLGTIIGNGKVYYQFLEIKKAPKLHSNKIDEINLNLIDKFYIHPKIENRVGGFSNDEERDAAMTRDSHIDIAFVRDHLKLSGTAMNILRRNLLE